MKERDLATEGPISPERREMLHALGAAFTVVPEMTTSVLAVLDKARGGSLQHMMSRNEDEARQARQGLGFFFLGLGSLDGSHRSYATTPGYLYEHLAARGEIGVMVARIMTEETSPALKEEVATWLGERADDEAVDRYISALPVEATVDFVSSRRPDQESNAWDALVPQEQALVTMPNELAHVGWGEREAVISELARIFEIPEGRLVHFIPILRAKAPLFAQLGKQLDLYAGPGRMPYEEYVQQQAYLGRIGEIFLKGSRYHDEHYFAKAGRILLILLSEDVDSEHFTYWKEKLPRWGTPGAL